MSDDQLVLILQNLLLTPSSDFYVSKLFYSADKKSLDPCVVSRIDLGVFEAFGVPFSIEIENLEVKGLSNTQVKFDAQGKPDIKVDGNQVTFNAKQPNTQEGYQRPPEVPVQIEAQGILHINIDGEQMPPGTLKLTVESTDPVVGVFSATEEVEGQLESAQVTFTALSVYAAADNENIVVHATLDTAFIIIINQILNRESSKQSLMTHLNNQLSSVESLSTLSAIATRYARQALSTRNRVSADDKQRLASDDIDASFAVRMPDVFMNDLIKRVYPSIDDVLGGVLSDAQLNIVMTWGVTTVPVISSYIGEMGVSFDAKVVVVADDYISFLDANIAVAAVFEPNTNLLVLKAYDAGIMTLAPEDPFFRAIFNSKKSDFLTAVNTYLSVFSVSSKMPDVFPPMLPGGVIQFPYDMPTETAFVAALPRSLATTNKIQKPTRAIKEDASAYDDVFRIQLNHKLLKKILDTQFWQSINKEFAAEGGLIRLLSFNLEMKDDYLALIIELGGRVRVDIPVLPDPEWSIDFASPLDVHLQVYVTADKQIRIRHSETYFPSFSLSDNNAYAYLYGNLVPGLKTMILQKIAEAIITNVKALVGGIDEPLFSFPTKTIGVGDKSITVSPRVVSISTYGPVAAPYLTLAGVVDTTVTAK